MSSKDKCIMCSEVSSKGDGDSGGGDVEASSKGDGDGGGGDVSDDDGGSGGCGLEINHQNK